MKKIVHLTSAHPRYDTRIFLKECHALVQIYSVVLVVADGLGNEVKDGIEIMDVGKPSGRTDRFFKVTSKVYRQAAALGADSYHLHDPELIPVGVKLKKKGFRVIFDAHEMVSEQIRSKHYLPALLRPLIAQLYRGFEKRNLKKFDGLILAEQSYYSYYSRINKRLDIVQNMPDTEFLKPYVSLKRKKNEIFYVGAISNDRGLDVTLQALRILHRRNIDFRMHYIGSLQGVRLDTLSLEKDIGEKIVFYGRMNLDDAYALSCDVKVGLSVLKPVGNYLHSYSTKIFEYMAIGLPVITSDFPLYRDVIEKNRCGICIDPLDAEALADAIESLFGDEEMVRQMGKRGMEASAKHYNWQIEKVKLLAFYGGLLS